VEAVLVPKPPNTLALALVPPVLEPLALEQLDLAQPALVRLALAPAPPDLDLVPAAVPVLALAADLDLALVQDLAAALVLEAVLALAAVLVRVLLTPLLKRYTLACEFTLVNKQIKG
jgi:hypothetical protein